MFIEYVVSRKLVVNVLIINYASTKKYMYLYCIHYTEYTVYTQYLRYTIIDIM